MNNENDQLNILINDPNNVAIMRKATIPFIKRLNEDEIQYCYVNAVWRSMKKYSKRKGKFTNYLFKSVQWECHKAISFMKNNIQIEWNNDTYSNNELLEMLKELPDKHKNILINRFIDNMTFSEIGQTNGYSHETARKRVKEALKFLSRNLTFE